MKVLSLILASAGLAAGIPSVGASRRAELGHFVARDTDPSIFSQLAPQLSPGAAIILPDDALFSTHQRWQAYSSPTYSVVVEVATEADVGTVVRDMHAGT